MTFGLKNSCLSIGPLSYLKKKKGGLCQCEVTTLGNPCLSEATRQTSPQATLTWGNQVIVREWSPAFTMASITEPNARGEIVHMRCSGRQLAHMGHATRHSRHSGKQQGFAGSAPSTQQQLHQAYALRYPKRTLKLPARHPPGTEPRSNSLSRSTQHSTCTPLPSQILRTTHTWQRLRHG